MLDTIRERHELNRTIRSFFESRDFLEVETRNLVPSPGTDVYIDPISVDVRGRDGLQSRYLHTSPEFAMKGVLARGYDRIYQLCKVYRDGEETATHAIEFTMLEWYRALADVSEIVDDVEQLCQMVLGRDGESWPRIPMAVVFDSAVGIDILECQTVEQLRDATTETVGLNPRASNNWDDIFFDLWVRFIDPWLAEQGAVFVTDWPARLAVLSQRDAEDPRIAKRFELFVDGLELANGFQELTDAVEQRCRFEADVEARRRLNKPNIPMPETFLGVLESGFPRSAGVALGVDRLLMLKCGVSDISQVLC